VNPCRICGRPTAFASVFCGDDVISCNFEGRRRLGMTKQVASWWRLRDYQRMFPKRRAA
jgi:hypothetical protein